MAINIGPFQQIVGLNMGKNEIRYVVYIAGDGGDTSVFPPPPNLQVITSVAGSWGWPDVTDTWPDVPMTNAAIRARIDEVDGYWLAFQDIPQPGPPSIMPILIMFLAGKWINDHRDFVGNIDVESISRFPSSSDNFSIPVTAQMTKDDLLETDAPLNYIG